MLANHQSPPNFNVVENNPWLYIKPPATALKINHDPKYIKHREGKDAIRKIFYLVPFDAFEEKHLTEFEPLIKAKNLELPAWWNRSEMLRWLYSSHFDIPKSIDNLTNHLQWFKQHGTPNLTAGGLKILQEGLIYQYGRDSQLRPVLVVNVYQIDTKKHVIEDFVSGLVYFLNIVKRNMFLPGYVESWVILLETNGMGVTSLPMSYVSQIISLTQGNFPNSLHKLYVLNPSFFLNSGWSIVKGLLDPETVEKINFLKKSGFDQMLQVIPKNQLEQRFGGDLPDLKDNYWPPRSTHDEPHVVVNTSMFEPGWDPQNYQVLNWKAPIQSISPSSGEIPQQQQVAGNEGLSVNATNASQPVQPDIGALLQNVSINSGKTDYVEVGANIPQSMLAGNLNPENLGPGVEEPKMSIEKK